MLLLALCDGCAALRRGDPPATDTPDAGDDAGTPNAMVFESEVHPLLMDLCGGCHGPSGDERSAWALSADPSLDLDSVLALSDPEDPASSPLLRIATGNGHVRLFTADSSEFAIIADWMAGAVPGPTDAEEQP